METKELLLALLENNKGTYLSGEEIAKSLAVSRTAVWKAVNGLRSDGYTIDAVRNKGYCLSVQSDILSPQGIQKYLSPICDAIDISILPAAVSTNTAVREKAAAGAPEGYLIIANTQTGGKGRGGRSFYSPPDTGIYMSLLLRPHRYSARQALSLTTMAAVAACEAIETVSGKQALIKWVNDIYVSDKKVAGILTEASLGLEDGFLEYVVLGIGMNVSLPKDGFPHDLKHIAGAVFSESQGDVKNRLAAEFLNRFMTCYRLPDETDYIGHYRQRSLVLGKEVYVICSDHRKKATALDIDDNCRLIVQYEDGTIDHLASGEISVKVSRNE